MEADLCGPYKWACTSCSVLVDGVIFFDFTILICLLLMQASQSSSTSPRLYSIALLIALASELQDSESEE